MPPIKPRRAAPRPARAAERKPAASNEPTAAERKDGKATPEDFLLSFLEGAEHFLGSLPDTDATKHVIAMTFMNACAEVTRTRFRMKFDAVEELCGRLTERLPLLRGSVAKIEERNTDEGFSRLLSAWAANNTACVKRIPAEAGQAVLDALYTRYTVSKPVTFEDILRLQFRWISANRAALEVFTKFAEGSDVLTPEQLAKFIRETQRADDVTDRQVTEKYKYRFGGGVHRYNFASYCGSVLTNNMVDPARTSDVWQDMTQSFTHYSIGCARVESEEDLKRVLSESVRAYVLALRRSANGTVCSGSCPLQHIIDGVKKSGFALNTYPIVLTLSPHVAVPLALQEEAARLLTEGLGPLLAKGLMFEGAAITDPKFSPGALRKRVLVASAQGALKPFVGFMVADMHKDGLGVRVTDVVEGTPAAKSGVLKDDWLTHIKGEAIRNKQHLRDVLATLHVGEEVLVKRENLDELTVVVGGAVDPQDRTVAPALSSIVFFRLTRAAADRKPWDTTVVDAAALPRAKLNRAELASHFAYTAIDGEADGAAPGDLGYASIAGIQFIDTDSSERCLSWSRGRFCDNGRCGYVLKTNLGDKQFPELNVDVLCGPRAVGCAALTSATTKIYGNGTARVSGTRLIFSGFDEASLAIAELTFEASGEEHVFVAAFKPTLARSGYRALPCLVKGEERATPKRVHGVYLFVR
ncbi:hypothetical protein STCU_01007 [Strigomonas culicis]|uniref:PDZ domain-containing protein n=1 Tax=Strigomonas culicis TaxID=28005 RepID=S9UXT5_9TRYP|nr:hypothetical protein STCU_01007 [Strigomonas culicis]|eukprot:EPY35667.1 hypothetical protein STCU_01007 [Strigomonas culicis]